MYEQGPWQRTPGEIRELAAELAMQYALGGPPPPGHPHANMEPNDYYGYFLASIDDVPADDSAALPAFLDQQLITSLAGLRALLRLVGSSAAVAALSWVLNEDGPQPVGGTQLTRDDVLREARAVLPYEWQDDGG